MIYYFVFMVHVIVAVKEIIVEGLMKTSAFFMMKHIMLS